MFARGDGRRGKGNHSTSGRAETASAVERLVRRACDGTAPRVDEEAVKTLKRTARGSEAALRCAHEAIFKAMRGRSAAQRVHAVTVANEFFIRSAAFRELTLERLEDFMKFAVGTDDEVLLPDEPKGEARRLRRHAVETLAGWEDKFKTYHRQLSLAKKFVRERLGDEAPEALEDRARREGERREVENQRKVKEKWLVARSSMKQDMLEEMIGAAKACTGLLRAFISANAESVGEDEEEWEDVARGAATEPGEPEVRVYEPKVADVTLPRTLDTIPVIEEMQGYYCALKHSYIPSLSDALSVLGTIQPAVLEYSVMTDQERIDFIGAFTKLKADTESVVGDIEGLAAELLGEDWNIRVQIPPTDSTSSKRTPTSEGAHDARKRSEWKKQVMKFVRAAEQKRRHGASLGREGSKKRKSHNEEVLAELGEDIFVRERRIQDQASEALAVKLMTEEITRHNDMLARGATPQERIENSMRSTRK